MESDRTIDWLRQERFIPWTAFHYDTSWAGYGAGAPVAAELSSLGIGGQKVGAAADEWGVIDLELPRIADMKQSIGLRVVWVPVGHNSSADSIHWKVFYDQWDFGEALVAPTTALDTVITSQVVVSTTSLVVHRTKRGVINANKFDNVARVGGISWLVEADSIGTFNADEPHFLGLLIDYMPKLCADGSQSRNYKSGLDET